MGANAAESEDDIGKADLVLAGGGVKGIAHVGAVKALHDLGYDRHPRIAGTSVGAIIGALLAHEVDVCDIWRELDEQDLSTMKDSRDWQIPEPPRQVPVLPQVIRTINDRLNITLPPPLDTLGLPGYQGVRPGLTATAWLRRLFRKYDITTFGALNDRRDPEKDKPPLVVLATDLTLGRLVQFPRDYGPVYGVDPDQQSVLGAVRASMSIPLFFDPYAIKPNGPRTAGVDGDLRTSRFIDGGVLANFAVDALDRQIAEDDPKAQPRWPTFGITLLHNETPLAVGRGLREETAGFGDIDDLLLGGDLLDFADTLIGTLVVGQDREAAAHWWMQHRTIEVDTTGYGVVQFGISGDGKRDLYHRGHAAAETFYTHRWSSHDDGGVGFDGRTRFTLPEVKTGDALAPCLERNATP